MTNLRFQDDWYDSTPEHIELVEEGTSQTVRDELRRLMNGQITHDMFESVWSLLSAVHDDAYSRGAGVVRLTPRERKRLELKITIRHLLRELGGAGAGTWVVTVRCDVTHPEVAAAMWVLVDDGVIDYGRDAVLRLLI